MPPSALRGRDHEREAALVAIDHVEAEAAVGELTTGL